LESFSPRLVAFFNDYAENFEQRQTPWLPGRFALPALVGLVATIASFWAVKRWRDNRHTLQV
jgi:hypothetical protein